MKTVETQRVYPSTLRLSHKSRLTSELCATAGLRGE